MDSFLSLEADDEKTSKDEARLGRIRIPPSIRTRTLSNLGRRIKRPATSSHINYYDTASSSSSSSLYSQSNPATQRKHSTKTLASAFDDLRVKEVGNSSSPNLFQETSASPTTLKNEDNNIWGKWLEVSETLTPIVNIGGTTSASSKVSSSSRHSVYYRQSWKLSNHQTTTTIATSASKWPPLCSPILDKEKEEVFGVKTNNGYPIQLRTAESFTRHSRIGHLPAVAAEMSQELDKSKSESSHMVDNPTTGGKVALRSLALLSRPISRDNLGQFYPSSPSSLWNNGSPISPAGEANPARVKASLEKQDSHNTINEEVPPLQPTTPTKKRHQDQEQEQVRPDSPTLPVMMLENRYIAECPKKIIETKKEEPPRVSFVLTASAKLPQADVNVRKKSSWTTRLKQAFSHKSHQRSVQCC